MRGDRLEQTDKESHFDVAPLLALPMVDSREIQDWEDTAPSPLSQTERESRPVPTQEEFAALMVRVQAGSSDAMWELIEHYGGHILAVVRRHINRKIRPLFDSTDFMQELFASMVRIRGRLNELDSPQRLVGMLAAMARNKVIDEVRRRTQTVRHGIEDQVHLSTLPTWEYEEFHSQDPSPSQVAVARERWNSLLAGQSARDQQIVSRRLEGATMAQIAAELAVHERTVRRVLGRLLRDIE